MNGFLVFLVLAAWQDFRYRGVRREFLLIFGILGVLFCIAQGRPWEEIIKASGPGILLLFLGHKLDGAIGEGDGWFFVVSGFYLNWQMCIVVLMFGLFLCGMFGLVLTVVSFAGGKSARKVRVPFLPFLLPVGLYLSFL